MKEEEKVILVNENDEQIGLMPKMEAHEKALLHRAFSVFVFNSKNELIDSMLNYINSKHSNVTILDAQFLSEKIVVDYSDYYYSNVIARASYTMTECRSKKFNIKSTGANG